jgi:hypothetical protein
MSPISEEYRLVISLKPKLLAIQDAANGTVSAYLAHPSLFALRIFVKQINKDLIDLRDTFAIISHLLYGNTTERITASLVEMTTFSFHILSQRDKFRWIDTHPIQPTDIDTIITSLRNISSMIDTNALIIIDTFAQSIERRDNPAAYNLSRSSSSSSTSTSSSGSSSSSSLSSPRYHSQPLPPFPSNHHMPPPLQRQSVRSLNLEDIVHPLSGLDVLAAAAANASGKKYRKTKVKRRRNIKATHRRPLVRTNSRKHRKQK